MEHPFVDVVLVASRWPAHFRIVNTRDPIRASRALNYSPSAVRGEIFSPRNVQPRTKFRLSRVSVREFGAPKGSRDPPCTPPLDPLVDALAPHQGHSTCARGGERSDS